MTRSARHARRSRIFILIVSIFLLIMAAAYLAVGVYYKDRFFPGSYINGEDCSGMTVDEVEKRIADSVTDYQITITERGGAEEVIDGSAIDFSYVSTGAVQELQEAQNSFNWMYAFFHPEDHSMAVETSYDESFLKMAMDKLECFQKANITDPEDAYIKENGTSYELVPEVEGNRLNKDKVLTLLSEAASQGLKSVDLEAGDCYEKPSITSKDENLVARYNTLVKYSKMTVTYAFGDSREVLDASTIKSWMTVADNGDVTFSDERISDYVAGLAEKYDTYEKDVPFTTALGETITVNSCDYGWELDQVSEVEKLKEFLLKGESVVREPLWLKMGVARTSNGIGDTYVEIDYTNQRMWFYKDGQLLVDTLVVTGNTSKDMGSPVGIFALYYKETNAILKGEDYKTPVDFWMPFYGGVGIHDAKWRDAFGGNLYQSSGSHGCINTPWANAKTIYENIDAGTPIVCYNAGTNLGQGTQAYEQPAETRNVEQELAGTADASSGTTDGTTAGDSTGSDGTTWDENTGSYDSNGDGVVTIN